MSLIIKGQISISDIHFFFIVCLYGLCCSMAKRNKISWTLDTHTIVVTTIHSLLLHMGFADYKKNIEFHQTYVFKG